MIQQDYLKKAKSFIEDNDLYIISMDSIIVDTSSSSSFVISYDKDNNTNIVNIVKDCDLKLIHIGEEKGNFLVDIDSNIKANITNLYLFSENKTDVDFKLICKDNSDIIYSEVLNIKDKANVKTSFDLLERSNLNIKTLSLNVDESNSNTYVYLNGEESNVDILSVMINSSSKKQVSNFNIIHNKQKTKSLFNSYCIANNSSIIKSDIIGLIEKDAKRAELKEKTKGMILDAKSSIESLPSLLINENDVVANHGASIGSINQDDLYYLMSRGLRKEEAERLMVESFIAPYFKDANDSEYILYIKELIKNKL